MNNATEQDRAPAPGGRRERTRVRIYAAAREVFLAHGFTATTMEQIALAAGVQRSTLYYHFRDKNEIFAGIAEAYLEAISAVIARLPGPRPTRSQIQAWVSEFAEFGVREAAPTLLLVNFSFALDAPPVVRLYGDRILEAYARQVPAFAEALQPNRGLAWARATTVLRELGWACTHHIRDEAMAPYALQVAVDLLDGFVNGEAATPQIAPSAPAATPSAPKAGYATAFDDIGRLTAADEYLDHQIADTFATIAPSDLNWTQKIWGALVRKDGSMSVSFGLGKYHNRNVLDGFAGVARGAEQWTVRASRRLDAAVQDMSVGPIRYEVVEPLQAVRFRLEANATQPIAFDILFEGELPPFFEKRNRRRVANRVAMDLVRYHQAGRLSGWVEVEGRREVVDDGWFGFRDHSWGTRASGVGVRAPDLAPNQGLGDVRLLWGPWLFTRPDGSKYELMHFWTAGPAWSYFSAHLNEAGEGLGEVRQIEVREMVPKVRFDPKTRRFLGGTYQLTLASGERRTIEVTPAGDTAFHLRTGEYGGWKGARHGSWRGDYHEDGEHIADVVAALPQLGQFRDAPVILRDGDAVGYGIQESMFVGVIPELGLFEESNFPIEE